ncbi:MAG: hypothetical protein QOH15_697, partial [Gaiellales bacterium]|nr:hypothetical protein [Gaiellales bacterium]
MAITREQLHAGLLDWFGEHGRDIPW